MVLERGHRFCSVNQIVVLKNWRVSLVVVFMECNGIADTLASWGSTGQDADLQWDHSPFSILELLSCDFLSVS